MCADLRTYQAPANCPECSVITPYRSFTTRVGGVLCENVAFHRYGVRQLPNTDEGIVANSTIDWWLDLPEHRKNLLAEQFERMAIGVDGVTEPDVGTRIYITQSPS